MWNDYVGTIFKANALNLEQNIQNPKLIIYILSAFFFFLKKKGKILLLAEIKNHGSLQHKDMGIASSVATIAIFSMLVVEQAEAWECEGFSAMFTRWSGIGEGRFL